jgi:membrane protein required for beta-lactamase induction
VRFGLRSLRRMSWPALLASCVMLAFVLTILPLALVLFAFFLLLKLAVGACFIGGRRQRRYREPRA